MRVHAGLLLVVSIHSAAAEPAEESPSTTEVPIDLAIPMVMRASHEQGEVVATSFGGYDTATDEARFGAAIEGSLSRRFAVRASVGNHGASADLRGAAGVIVGLVDRDNVDVAVAAQYETKGWNTVAAVSPAVLTGFAIGDTRVVSETGVGVGLEEGELYGAARLVAYRRIAGRFSAGLDAQGHLDLERDASEPPGEPDWDLRVGPFVAASFSGVALGLGAGAATLRYRGQNQSRSGAVMTFSAARTF